MCGICGFYQPGKTSDVFEEPRAVLQRMSARLIHRGPDGNGIWQDEAAGLGLAHQRLSIRDTSSAGAQPMRSSCGRYVICYNGELYNGDELREEIARATGKPPRLQGHCDTEILLEACAALGVERTLSLTIGMFAFALWDSRERKLTVARDRFGVKPLYWTRQNGLFAFASELKALRELPGCAFSLDRNNLAAFFRCNYLPDPLTIFSEIKKLRPGWIMTVAADGSVSETQWWSALDVALAGMADRVTSHRDALEELHRLLRDAVRRRMIADVPLGAFLSGGVDSSLVVALMQEASLAPVRTFCIGFAQSEFNEAPYAKAVAEALGTEHTEHYVTADEALAVIPRLPVIYDDLFADSSQIPTYLLCKLARESVTVVLTGDGGDELFAGYWQNNHPIPFVRHLPLSRSLLHQRKHFGRWAGRNPVIGGSVPREYFVQGITDDMFPADQELTQYIDTMHYLPGDILTKVDRASMAVSLEARPPLLDHRVYAFAWRMPPTLRRACGKGKWPLRHLLDGYVSPELTERPKQGFAPPLTYWLQHELREWVEDLLDPVKMRQAGWLDAATVQKMWKDVQEGRQKTHPIWAVLMFQQWISC